MKMSLPRPLEEDAAPGTSLADFVRDRLGQESRLIKQDFLIENWQWVGLLSLVLLGLVLERIVSASLRRLAHKAAGTDRALIDEQRLTGFVRPFGVLVTWWVFVALLPQLDLRNVAVDSALEFLGSVILSLAGIVAAWRAVDLFCDFLRARAEKTQNKFDDMLVPLLRRTLKIFVVLAGVAYVASRTTEDLWTLLAGLSVGGAVLAFAFKDSLENVFGTFTVLLDKPFQLGDWITVEGVDGTVERVGFRSTRVRTFYNSLITVPNQHFIGASGPSSGSPTRRRPRRSRPSARACAR